MEARRYSRLEDPEDTNNEYLDGLTEIKERLISATPIYSSISSSISATKSSKLCVNNPEDIEIGGKPLDEYINEKVNEGIINNISKIATVLPTDISLGNNQVLVMGVEVGDVPVEQVERIFNHISETFKEKGLTKVVLYPKRFGVGDIDFDNICVEDKYIE